eukprot:657688-Pelagomonas_calceolata.AAC.11
MRQTARALTKNQSTHAPLPSHTAAPLFPPLTLKLQPPASPPYLESSGAPEGHRLCTLAAQHVVPLRPQ